VVTLAAGVIICAFKELVKTKTERQIIPLTKKFLLITWFSLKIYNYFIAKLTH
jgi:large-conductance mechanosensitive channel